MFARTTKTEREDIIASARLIEDERYRGQSTTIGKLKRPTLQQVVSRIRNPIQVASTISLRDKSQLLMMLTVANPSFGTFDPTRIAADLGVISRNASSKLYALTPDGRPCITEKGFLLAKSELDFNTDDSLEADFHAKLDALPETERTMLVQARIGQDLLKKTLMKTERRCQLTDITAAPVLRASHIRPWSDPNQTDRLNPRNALLLAAHVDACFDKHLISFGETGEIWISTELTAKDQERLGLFAKMRLRGHERHQQFLAEHRRKFRSS